MKTHFFDKCHLFVPIEGRLPGASSTLTCRLSEISQYSLGCTTILAVHTICPDPATDFTLLVLLFYIVLDICTVFMYKSTYCMFLHNPSPSVGCYRSIYLCYKIICHPLTPISVPISHETVPSVSATSGCFTILIQVLMHFASNLSTVQFETDKLAEGEGGN
jgi:hypothetical protein